MCQVITHGNGQGITLSVVFCHIFNKLFGGIGEKV